MIKERLKKIKQDLALVDFTSDKTLDRRKIQKEISKAMRGVSEHIKSVDEELLIINNIRQNLLEHRKHLKNIIDCIKKHGIIRGVEFAMKEAQEAEKGIKSIMPEVKKLKLIIARE